MRVDRLGVENLVFFVVSVFLVFLVVLLISDIELITR